MGLAPQQAFQPTGRDLEKLILNSATGAHIPDNHLLQTNVIVA